MPTVCCVCVLCTYSGSNSLALLSQFYIHSFSGVLKVKYGLVGHFEKNGIIWSQNLHTKRMIDVAIGFTEFQSTDVIVAAYPKAGKTLEDL